MRPLVDPSTIVLVVLALVLAAVAYVKDPGLPLIGAKNGFSMLRFILPRLVPALMLAGLMQVLIPQEVVSRHFGRAGGLRAILIAAVAGGLHDVVVALRHPADHRLGGAADGLALRHRPRRPEPRLPRRGGLARRRLLPRVSAIRE